MTLFLTRETLKRHSVPRAELPAFEFSLPSHYAHCPQPPPLIDLGPVPRSNCFLQIGFAPGCWLWLSNLSPPYCPLLCPPSLIFKVASEAMHLTHQLIPGPQEQWRHLEKNYLGALEHTHKKNPRGSDVFLPSSTHLSGCRGIVDMIPVKTENSSKGMAGWWIPYVTLYLRSLKYLFF